MSKISVILIFVLMNLITAPTHALAWHFGSDREELEAQNNYSLCRVGKIGTKESECTKAKDCAVNSMLDSPSRAFDQFLLDEVNTACKSKLQSVYSLVGLESRPASRSARQVMLDLEVAKNYSQFQALGKSTCNHALSCARSALRSDQSELVIPVLQYQVNQVCAPERAHDCTP